MQPLLCFIDVLSLMPAGGGRCRKTCLTKSNKDRVHILHSYTALFEGAHAKKIPKRRRTAKHYEQERQTRNSLRFLVRAGQNVRQNVLRRHPAGCGQFITEVPRAIWPCIDEHYNHSQTVSHLRRHIICTHAHHATYGRAGGEGEAGYISPTGPSSLLTFTFGVRNRGQKLRLLVA